MNLRTLLPLQGPSWYQEKSWDQAPGNFSSATLTLQNAKNTSWEHDQLSPVDHTHSNVSLAAMK